MFAFPETYCRTGKEAFISEILLDEIATISGVLVSDINSASFLDERMC